VEHLQHESFFIHEKMTTSVFNSYKDMSLGWKIHWCSKRIFQLLDLTKRGKPFFVPTKIYTISKQCPSGSEQSSRLTDYYRSFFRQYSY